MDQFIFRFPEKRSADFFYVEGIVGWIYGVINARRNLKSGHPAF